MYAICITVIALIFVVIIVMIIVVIIIIVNFAIAFGYWSVIIWLLLLLSLTRSFFIIYIYHYYYCHYYYCYYYYFMFHSATTYGVSKKKRKQEKDRRLNWVIVKNHNVCSHCPFRRLNLCLRCNICASSDVILTWRRSEPDHEGSNPSGVTRKKQQKPVQQKGSHDDKRKADTLIPPTTQPTMKMINQNDLLQYCSPPDSNYISTASCALQIDEEKEQKNLY